MTAADPGRLLLDKIDAREQALAREPPKNLPSRLHRYPITPPASRSLPPSPNSAAPLRARDLCLTLDLPIVPKNTENIRSKLKRLASRGILVETEPGLFAQPRP